MLFFYEWLKYFFNKIIFYRLQAIKNDISGDSFLGRG